MNREIKFRGKEFTTNKWVYGDLLHVGDSYIIATNSNIREPLPAEYNLALAYAEDEIAVIISKTVGQYTGLKDANGKEIYEGDIIEDIRSNRHVVKWIEESAKYGAVLSPQYPWNDNDGSISQHWIDKFKKIVIGNIYDNPELLKNE